MQHQANERTFPAWMRTDMAVMGSGFIVGKFSVMANKIAASLTGKTSVALDAYFANVGMTLIAVATVLAPTIYIRYKMVEYNIVREIYRRNTYLALFMIVIGFSMGIMFILHLLEIV